jgi:release factor glutamine methyltransferase
LIEEFGSDDEALRAATRRRLAGEPLQYVIGHWPFRTLDLDVDDRALIPRPETELLVEIALSELAATGVVAPIILDMGCGSGAIGLALAVELRERGVGSVLIAVDESSQALDLARQNARKHDVQSVSFVVSNWFDDLADSLRGKIDLMVANPPYVAVAEFDELDPVLRHEPFGALVAPDGDDVAGFADLFAVIAGARSWLSPHGVLVCEHGEGQRDAVLAAARAADFRETLDLDDLSGRPRVLVARR